MELQVCSQTTTIQVNCSDSSSKKAHSGYFESLIHRRCVGSGRVTGKPEVTCFEWEPGFVRRERGWFT